MNTKKQYTPPTLTVVAFKAEQGYAGSNSKMMLFSLFSALEGSPNVPNSQESWSDEQNLFGTW